MSSISDKVKPAIHKGIEGLQANGEAKSEVDTVGLFAKIMKKMQSISESS
jgi:hypothetical protein